MSKTTKLVLGRKFGEGIELLDSIGNTITVSVENNRAGGGVRLIVHAPLTVKIGRIGGPLEKELTGSDY